VNNPPPVDHLATAGAEAVARGACGAMLYDASRVDQPGAAIFDREYWRDRGSLGETAGGRGTVAFMQDDTRRWVLRHYRRGGLIARLSADGYLWFGEERVRSFREWRLLRQLAAWRLPVPVPVAARYERSGLTYRADLITEELPTRLTLARALQVAPLDAARWRSVGSCIGQFHAHGVQHADLNAHNVLLGEAGAAYVLDFDRGRIRNRGGWEQGVLQRLRRSLLKVTDGLPPDRCGEQQWQWLIEGCAG
jgi:3-deoxy-D-manno-octulosonic acid kinase